MAVDVPSPGRPVMPIGATIRLGPPNRYGRPEMLIPQRFRGDVTVGQLCDVVAAVGEKPEAVDSEVRHIYEWHHSRGVMGIQIAVTSAVVAAVATFADDHSRFAVPAGLMVAAVSVVLGLSLLVRLNRLPDEYAAALRFARRLQAHRAPLNLYPDRERACEPLRSVKMAEFRTGTPAPVSAAFETPQK
jgi:hypothetical protein